MARDAGRLARADPGGRSADYAMELKWLTGDDSLGGMRTRPLAG